MKVLLKGYHTTGTADIPTRIRCSFTKFDRDINNLHLTLSYYLVQTSDNEFYINFFEENESRRKVLFQPDGEVFKHVSGGRNAFTLLTEKGDIFRLKFNQSDGCTVDKIPRFLEDEERVENIACGHTMDVILTSKGKLYDLPKEVYFHCDGIKDIAVGREHCIILSKNGQVYTFGNGSRGQLGTGDLEKRENPVLLEGLVGINIVAVNVGGWHSCAISEEGDLYSWGWNGNGQLGIGDEYSVMASPHVVDFEDYQNQINVVSVACGFRHTLALLSEFS